MSAPQPPVDESTPFMPQFLLTIGCITAAVCFIGLAVCLWHKERSFILGILILGATVASLQEAPLDIFVSAYYPEDDLWVIYETFDRPIPIWATFAWMVLFAGAPYQMAQAMRQGNIRKATWIGVVGCAITDLLIELPCLSQDLYYYYGDQPLRIGGFPMTMVIVNCSTMMSIALAVYLWEYRLKGRMRFLLVLPPFFAVPAGTMSTGLPVWSAVGAGASTPVMILGAVASFALALGAIHGMTRIAEHFGDGRDEAVTAGSQQSTGADRQPVTA